MALLRSKRFFVIASLFCVLSSSAILKRNNQCNKCAGLVAKADNFVSNSQNVDDNQIDALWLLCRDIYCACDLSNTIQSLFAGDALSRIKKYFNDQPKRLNNCQMSSVVYHGGQTIFTVLVPIIVDHVDDIKSSTVTTMVIDPSGKKTFIDALEKCPKGKSLIILFVMTAREIKGAADDIYNYGWKAIKNKIDAMTPDKNKAMSLEYVFYLFLYKYVHGSLPKNCTISSQTAQHLLSLTKELDGGNNYGYYYGQSVTELLTKYVDHKRPTTVVDRIIALEQEYANNGYYTFVHGQRWQYHLLEQWYTWLWELQENRAANDYTFIHCRKLKKEKLEQQKEFRKKIMADGRIDMTVRERLLFLNAPFFGNLTRLGSCTSWFAYENSNINDISFTLEKIFDMFDCAAIYAKYKDEFDALESEHKALSKHGQVLLLAVPKNIIKECVYVASPGGYKRKVTVDGKETNDVQVILEALRADASRIVEPDQIEYCLTLTDDMLTPDSGIKVRSLPMIDDAKIKAFDTKARDLFEKMKKELQTGCEIGKKVKKCVNQINDIREAMKGQDAANIAAKVQCDVLANLSDDEKTAIKERLLKRLNGLRKLRTGPYDYNGTLIDASGPYVVNITTDTNNVLKVHELISDQKVSIKHHFGNWCPNYVLRSPNERFVVFASYKNALIWDTTKNTIQEISKNDMRDFVISDKYLIFSNYSYSYVSGPNYEICIYDVEKTKFLKSITGQSNSTYIMISPDSKYLFGYCDNKYNVWDIETGTSQYSYPYLSSAGCLYDGCTFKINDKYVIAVRNFNGDKAMFFDMTTGKEISEIPSAIIPNGSVISGDLHASKDRAKLLYLTSGSAGNWEIHERTITDGSENVHLIKAKNVCRVLGFDENYVIAQNNSGDSITIWTYDTDTEKLINKIFA